MIDFDKLRTVPLFADLSDERLRWLGKHLTEIYVKAGDAIMREGETKPVLFLVLEGEVRATTSSGARQIPTNRFVAPSFFGGASLLAGRPSPGTATAATDSHLALLPERAFRELLVASEAFSRVIFRSSLDRLTALEATVRNREKLAALGTLAAGLAHELNNPSAAVARTADCAVATLAMLNDAAVALGHSTIPSEAMSALDSLGARKGSGSGIATNALQQSAAEDALHEWLGKRGVEQPWLKAPCLARIGITPADLEPIAGRLNDEQFAASIRWLAATLELRSLVEETRRGAVRISEIVKAMKSYSYMDQAPQQAVDLHDGIDDTLTIMQHRLKHGVTVRREYDRSLPHLVVHGSELNQVWTNLIDNAIDAMEGKGEIVIRTRRDANDAVIEITDNGPGIAPEVMPHLFEPFFTTKPLGQGTGLGLDLSYQTVVQRHGGEIRVESRPGGTTFQVRLPLAP
ncbi:signal transduction histidine kinase [Paraburkholderia sp. WC7.3g]|uniref:sensor histidine kinase n=1 Tax=Paraburkholderia sp. WC7.3g TaxID=2991070 RepID=UPI003D223C2C